MNVGIFVILLGAVLLQQVFQISANHCDYNEDETPCKSCTENCCDGQQNVKKCPKPCLDVYKNGKFHTCQCKKNLYRTVFGKCVAKCPRKCPAGEVPTECDFPCQATCANPNKPPCPTFACGDGDCVCPKGQVRKVEGGKCVPCDKCCPKNEEFKQCGTSCEPSCKVPEPKICNKMCKLNVCQCKKGFVRNGPKGSCIEKGSCPY